MMPAREDSWEGINDLDTLRSCVLECTACELRRGAKGVVFGEGNPAARILLVGEGPGRDEDLTGRPFVGRAGQLLDSLLKSVGLTRKDVFIANIVKCRPPGNRLPFPAEVEKCLPHLRAQIRILKPRIVVLLGALASQTLLDPSIRVTRDRGKWFEREGVSYLVTFHPAAVLRDEFHKKQVVLEDFRSLQCRWFRA
ncbi:MAG: uracil-DNA glycosylase [Bacillota bacterium]